LVVSQGGHCPQLKWIEFGSKKAAAILARLPASRVRAYMSIALRAARPHPGQACLAFSNPSTSSGNRIQSTLATLTRLLTVIAAPTILALIKGLIFNIFFRGLSRISREMLKSLFF
jgi:hypothetical protein